jgi:hypothetical protein
MDLRLFATASTAIAGLVLIAVGVIQSIDEALFFLIPLWTRPEITYYKGLIPHHCASVAAAGAPWMLLGILFVLVRKKAGTVITRISMDTRT